MAGEYRVLPIEDRTWIGSIKRETSRFTAGWRDTENQLLYEIQCLRGSNIVIRVDVTPDQLRLDGTLRANARTMSDAVVVEFETPDGAISFKQDRYNDLPWRPSMTQIWQHNVRAVMKTLEALRAVDRYGSMRGEQYTGFKALPSGIGLPASGMTSDDAVALLKSVVGLDAYLSLTWESLVKRVRAKTHPDVNDGDHALWDQIEKAIDTLSRSGRGRTVDA